MIRLGPQCPPTKALARGVLLPATTGSPGPYPWDSRAGRVCTKSANMDGFAVVKSGPGWGLTTGSWPAGSPSVGFPDSAQAGQAPRPQLLAAGLEPALTEQVEAARRRDPAADLDACRRLGLRVVTWDDPDYPERLRVIDYPPAVLFVKGNPLAVPAGPPFTAGMSPVPWAGTWRRAGLRS